LPIPFAEAGLKIVKKKRTVQTSNVQCFNLVAGFKIGSIDCLHEMQQEKQA
jgi:hypothetical protein